MILLVVGLKFKIWLRKDWYCFLGFFMCEINEREKCDFELVGVKGLILEESYFEVLDWWNFYLMSWKYGL